MSDNLKEVSERGARVRELVQNTPGWKDIKDVFDAIRKEAFQDWTTLNLNATPEQILNIRAKELVVRDILERIENLVVLGDEARNRMAGDVDPKISFDVRPETPTDEEIGKLFRPLKKWYTDLVHSDNPKDGTATAKMQ